MKGEILGMSEEFRPLYIRSCNCQNVGDERMYETMFTFNIIAHHHEDMDAGDIAFILTDFLEGLQNTHVVGRPRVSVSNPVKLKYDKHAIYCQNENYPLYNDCSCGAKYQKPPGKTTSDGVAVNTRPVRKTMVAPTREGGRWRCGTALANFKPGDHEDAAKAMKLAEKGRRWQVAMQAAQDFFVGREAKAPPDGMGRWQYQCWECGEKTWLGRGHSGESVQHLPVCPFHYAWGVQFSMVQHKGIVTPVLAHIWRERLRWWKPYLEKALHYVTVRNNDGEMRCDSCDGGWQEISHFRYYDHVRECPFGNIRDVYADDDMEEDNVDA